MPRSRTRKSARPPGRDSVPQSLLSGRAWSATRQAREAVRTRDDLIQWLDTGVDAHGPTRRFVQIDTAGRLLDWYGTELRNAVMMARASSGLDVDGSEDLAGLARLWTSTRRARLRSLPVFIISPEMADVCIAAALTLNTSDTADACQR